MKKALVTVVIPLRLEEPSVLEKISLTQVLAVLHRHPITFMAPAGLNTAWYEDYCKGKATVRVERFDWKGHEAYGELLTAPVFYERFRDYQYLLVYHLDAFVFRDELEQWCQCGYDYIGAVIYSPAWFSKKRPLRQLLGIVPPEYFGNGGFALKKVETFYRITSRFKAFINLYHWTRKLRKVGFLDDIFVSLHFPRLMPSFRIAPKALAQRFGAEYVEGGEASLPFIAEDSSSLPFGIHGWIQFQPDYWKPCIRQYGHAV